MSKIGDHLKEGKVVELLGIGFLFVITTPKLKGLSPITRKEIIVPARNKLRIETGYGDRTSPCYISTEELRGMLTKAGFEIVSVKLSIEDEELNSDSNASAYRIWLGDGLGRINISRYKTPPVVRVNIASKEQKLEELGIKGFVVRNIRNTP